MQARPRIPPCARTWPSSEMSIRVYSWRDTLGTCAGRAISSINGHASQALHVCMQCRPQACGANPVQLQPLNPTDSSPAQIAHAHRSCGWRGSGPHTSSCRGQRKAFVAVIETNKATRTGQGHVPNKNDRPLRPPGEDIDGDEVALGVTVLAGLGGGHIHDLCSRHAHDHQFSLHASWCMLQAAGCTPRHWASMAVPWAIRSAAAVTHGGALLHPCCCAYTPLTLQGLPLMQMKPFLRMVPACWG